jgi:hypothetical protein
LFLDGRGATIVFGAGRVLMLDVGHCLAAIAGLRCLVATAASASFLNGVTDRGAKASLARLLIMA